jgi:hypothetical protein
MLDLRYCSAAIGLAALSWGCGGSVNVTSPTSTDGGAASDADVAADAGAESSAADSAPDHVAPLDGGTDFCSGPTAKVLYNGTLATPQALSSVTLMLDCCEGAAIDVHTQASIGVDLRVRVESEPGPFRQGEYALGASEGFPWVRVSVGMDSQLAARPTGTLRVQPGDRGSTLFAFCLSVGADQPEPLKGAQIYIPEVSLAPWDWNNRWGIWLLADPNISAVDAAKLPLESLQLASSPVVDMQNIAWYEASNHKVRWDSWGMSVEALRNSLPRVEVEGLPFVLQVDSKPVYMGAFWSNVSSVGLQAPLIVLENIQQDGFVFEAPFGGPDLRNDSRIISVLQQSWKLVP